MNIPKHMLDSRFRLPAMLRIALQAGGNDRMVMRVIPDLTRLGEAFRLCGSAKRRSGATTAGVAWVGNQGFSCYGSAI